jgi:hypothetical protein
MDLQQRLIGVTNSYDIETATSAFIMVITQAADETIPLTSLGSKSVPWWTQDLTIRRRRVNNLRRKYQRTTDTYIQCHSISPTMTLASKYISQLSAHTRPKF